jgi:hypothetical protein
MVSSSCCWYEAMRGYCTPSRFASPIGREKSRIAQKQKVALVTGSALNIGRQIALHLALEGYRV